MGNKYSTNVSKIIAKTKYAGLNRWREFLVYISRSREVYFNDLRLSRTEFEQKRLSKLIEI